MRVVGGIYRSRAIVMPKGADIRPTQDKVRQAIFNILQDVQGTEVLELFAGSGAFGIEALSRGARHVTFVDNNPHCIRTIKKNLESLKILPAFYTIIKANALETIALLHTQRKMFNLVFLDPPYHQDLAKKCLISLNAYVIVNPSSLVVTEHFKCDELPNDLDNFSLLTERKYSDTRISIYRAR